MNKQFLLDESKSFCMYPWIHLNTTPEGRASPCCVSSYTLNDNVGLTRNNSIIELVNSDAMKTIRKEMLSEKMPPSCEQCHGDERRGIQSARNGANTNFGKYFDEAVPNTNDDGSLTSFKMRYFDIRFSNICNFKCRTCDSCYSSQWEAEDLKSNRGRARIIPKNNRPEFVQDVLSYIPDIDMAYFAGGETLITEEHYILLEEMIRQQRTDIVLRYNTNLSNLRFKNKDLLTLWKNFSNPIEVYASIDHYGTRAEYIRHGTDWSVVENNFITARNTPYIQIQMNTVVSVYNFVTLHDFYNYLLTQGLYKATDHTFSTFNMSSPAYFASRVLPKSLKQIGKEGLQKMIGRMTLQKFGADKLLFLKNAIVGTMSEDTWEQQKDDFQEETRRLDMLRGESFVKTFPELQSMVD